MKIRLPKIGIATKFFVVIVSLILCSLLLLIVFVRNQIHRQSKADIVEYRVEAQHDSQQELINYVSIAMEVVESEYLKAHTNERLIERFGPRLEKVISVVSSILVYKASEIAAGNISVDQAKDQALDEIRAIRYDNGTGYVWVNDTGQPIPRMIMHPTVPALDGELLDDPKYDVAYGAQKNLFQAFVDVCLESGSGYVDYLWPKPTADGLTSDQPKLSYVALFEPWGWIIGTGIYIDEADLEAQKTAQSILKSMRYDNGVGYFWINDTTTPIPRMVMHPTVPALDGTILDDPKYNVAFGTDKNLFQAFVDVCIESGAGFVDYMWPKPTTDGLTVDQPKLSYVQLFAPWNWVIGTGYYIDSIDAAVLAKEESIEAQLASLSRTISIIGAILLIAAVLFAIVFAGRISRALKTVATGADRIAAGNFSTGRLHLKRNDEIGQLAKSFSYMQDTLANKSAALRTIANGDLTIDVDTSGTGDELGESLSTMRNSLSSMIQELTRAIEEVSTGSSQISVSSQSLSQKSAEQASAVEEISSSLTEVNGQATQNATSAHDAVKVSAESLDSVKIGVASMSELSEAMDEIQSSSSEISKLSKLVDDIAFQINLLSLNANVEAARAGKQGAGFAVVADEIRNLSDRTTKALNQTVSIIEESNRSISRGKEACNTTAERFNAIADNVRSIVELLENIERASSDQAEALTQVSEGIEQIEQITQSHTADVEQSAVTSGQLADQGRNLTELIQRFKTRTN